jgi:ferredoxin
MNGGSALPYKDAAGAQVELPVPSACRSSGTCKIAVQVGKVPIDKVNVCASGLFIA